VEGGSIPNWAWHRHMLSRGGNLYASAVLGLGVADSTAGYRAYSARILRMLELDRIRAEGYGFQIEMTYRCRQHGARITEVPIKFVDREAGESKMSSFIVVEALGLVTFWGLGRIVYGARNLFLGGRRKVAAPKDGAGVGAGAGANGTAAVTAAAAAATHSSPPPSEALSTTDTEKPVRSA
jgi:dolichol-phosphate mannosyltransferase